MQSQEHRNSSYSRFYTRIFGLVTALILGGACYRLLLPFIAPLLWALLFTLLLHPLHAKLTRWLRGRNQLSAGLLIALTFIALVGPITGITAAFVHQASDLLQVVQGWLSAEGHDPVSLSNQPVMQDALSWLARNTGITLDDLRNWTQEAAHASLSVVATASGKLFMGALGTVIGLLLTLFFMFFFIRDGEDMVHAVRELVPLPASKREELFSYLAAVTRAVMFGVGLTALVQGALVGISLLIVGAPSPLVLGVLATVCALLPIGGTALVWIPAGLILFAQGRWGAGIFILIWGFLVSLTDNVLKPLLISGRARVATLTVFIGVLGGVRAYGPLGLFLGPVVLALAIALIEFTLQSQRRKHVIITTESPATVDTDESQT
ncbi:MAG TPA: AI-2E family transporter [Steroidobacteraceae bacterium]|jgi:predicted PurR-regulated permease PerM|nr:AI-2E family transporter [Steroidobacteraceae bacterium]